METTLSVLRRHMASAISVTHLLLPLPGSRQVASSGTIRCKDRLSFKVRQVAAGALAFLATACLATAADTTAWLFVTDGAADVIRQYDPQGNEVGALSNPLFNFPTFLTADTTT